MNHVARPHIPYRGHIPGGVHDGKLIEIKGHVPYGADVFAVNLLTGLDPNSDRALHISVRFNGRVVVRNTMQQGTWGPEEREGLFPFATGQDFTLLILVNPESYRIAINSQHCFEYFHRIPHARVNAIYIDGNVRIERIEFVDKMNPYQRPGIFQPSYPVYPSGGSSFPYQRHGFYEPYYPAYPAYPVTSGGYYFPGLIPGVCSIPTAPAVCPPAVGVFPATVCPTPSFVIPPPEQITVCPPATGISSSNLAPVYNPTIPYAYPIYGGLKPGMMIYISGRPSASAYRFTINLQGGSSPYPPPDIAFHLDARFFNATVVRNSRNNNSWGKEEVTVHHFPFQHAVNFDLIIKIDSDRYMVALNGQHFCEFRHRLHPLSRFDTLYIENDIVVSSIRFA